MGGSEGWQSPPARGHAELSTTAWSGATEQKAISCLMRGLANEEGTEPLETLLGLVLGERDAAPAEMWSTGLCTSKQIWISQHHSKMEPQHPHHCHPRQGAPGSTRGLWHTRTTHPMPEEGWDGGDRASPCSHPLPARFPSRSV